MREKGQPPEAGRDALTTVEVAGSAKVVVPEGGFIFAADFTRQDSDLLIEGREGEAVLVEGYFAAQIKPVLATPAGAQLTPDLVEALLFQEPGPLQLAQAAPAVAAAAIGQVEQVQGAVQAFRAGGASERLAQGDPVFQGDVIQTAGNSTIGITFVDGTVFSLSPNARMTLDEMVYSAGGGGNSMTMSILTGTFAFITGQVAPTGNMTVNTPVAAIGIRGTTLSGEILSAAGDTRFVLRPDPDGSVGIVALTNAGGQTILDEAFETVTLTSFNTPHPPTSIVPPAVLLADPAYLLTLQILNESYELFQRRRGGDEGDESEGGGTGGEDESGALSPDAIESLEAGSGTLPSGVGPVQTELSTFTPPLQLVLPEPIPPGNNGERPGSEGSVVVVDPPLPGPGPAPPPPPVTLPPPPDPVLGLTIFGTPDDDVLTGGPGNDTIIGGAGIDTAVFSGTPEQYTFLPGSIIVIGPDGTDTLIEIEILRFVEGNSVVTLNVPDAVDDAFTTRADDAIDGNVFEANGGAADSDADGDLFAVTAVNGNEQLVGNQFTLASGALLTLNADGTFVYDPNGAFDGLQTGQTATDSFTYRIEDDTVAPGDGLPDEASVTITINPPNAAPTAVDDPIATAEDTAITIAVADLLSNDSDPEGDPLQVTAFGDPQNGSLQVNGNGTVAYTPDADFNGVDSFTYTIDDGNGGTDSATVTITVEPVNDAPTFVLADDQFVDEDAGALTVTGFASNISPGGGPDEDGQALSFSISTNNDALFAVGPAIDPVTGDLTYTLADDANGVATVTVTLIDDGGTANGGQDSSDPQTFTINVRPVNDAPVLQTNAGLRLDEGTTQVIESGLLSAEDIDTSAANIVFQITDLPVNGEILFDGDPIGSSRSFTQADLEAGLVAYRHFGDENSSDSFSFTVTDGTTTLPAASFQITVDPVNDPPEVLPGQPLDLAENAAAGTAVGTVVALDPDPGDSLSFAIIGGNVDDAFAIDAATGQITVNNPGVLDFETTNSFALQVQATDSVGATGFATVTVNLTDVNEAPTGVVLSNDSVPENIGGGSLIGFLVATDEDINDTATFTILSDPDNKFQIGGQNGDQLQLAVNANLDFEAQTSHEVMVQVTDSAGNTYDETFVIRVTNVNEAPVVAVQNFSVAENQTVVGEVQAADPENDPLTFEIVGGPDEGEFVIDSATGALSFVTAPDFEAPADADGDNEYLVQVRASDSGGLADTATVTVTVTDLDEAFVWTNGTGNQAWEDSGNWSGGQVPGVNDTAEVTGGSPGPIVSDSSATQEVAALVVSQGGAVTVSGGALNIQGPATFDSDSSLTLTGGSYGGSGDTAISGAFLWSGGTITGSGGFLYQGLSGTIAGPNAKTLDGRTLTVDGPLTISGTSIGGSGAIGNLGALTVLNAVIDPTLSNQGTLLLQLSSIFNGAFENLGNATLRLEANPTLGSAALTLGQGFENLGTIELVSAGGLGTFLTVSSGTLVNQGIITALAVQGSGGGHTITGTVVNTGVLQALEQNLTINNIDTTFTNSGQIDIADGQMLSISGGNTGVTELQSGTALTGTGTFRLQGTHTLNLGIDLTIGPNSPELDLNGSATVNGISGAGSITVEAGGSLVLTTDTINVALTNQGSLELRTATLSAGLTNEAGGILSALSGSSSITNPGGTAFSNAAQATLIIEASSALNGTIFSVADGFTNAGQILITSSTDVSPSAVLNVGGNTLVNAATGTIQTALAALGPTNYVISGSLDNQGVFDVDQSVILNTGGGTVVNGGAIDVADAQTLTIVGGSTDFTGGTITGAGTIDFSGTAQVDFGAKDVVTGDAGVDYGFSGQVTVNGTGTFTNLGPALALSSDVFNLAFVNQGGVSVGLVTDFNQSFLNEAGATFRIEGTATAGGGATFRDAVTNQGTIELSSLLDAQTTINLQAGALINEATGTIAFLAGAGGNRVVNGSLQNNGTLQAAQATTFNGDLSLLGGLLEVAGGATVLGGLTLDGGTIRNGSLTLNGTTTVLNNANNLLDGITLGGVLTLGSNLGFVTVANGLTGQPGAEVVLAASLARVAFSGTQSIADLTFQLDPAGGGAARQLLVSGAGAVVTFEQGVTVSGGNGEILSVAGGLELVNLGSILATAPGQAITIGTSVFSNEGTIGVNGGGALLITAASWDNGDGRIELAADSFLLLGGSFTTAGLGTLDRDLDLNGVPDGTVTLAGLLDNTGATLTFDAATGSWDVNGGTILGGILQLADGQGPNFLNNPTNLLDGVTLEGTITLTASSAFLGVENGLSSTTGADVVLDANLARLQFTGTQTISGVELVFDPSSSGAQRQLIVAEDGAVVTLAADAVIQGGLGRVFSPAAGGALLNQGLIAADLSGQSLEIDSITLTNDGVVRATDGGTLSIDTATLTNLSGTTLTGGVWEVFDASTLDLIGASIATNNAEVTLSGAGSAFAALDALADNQGTLNLFGGRSFTTLGALDNSGSLTVGEGAGDSAALNVSGDLNNAVTGLVAGTGTISVSGGTFVNAGTFSPGNSAGSLLIVGDFTQDPSGVLVVELGGSDAGTFDVLTITNGIATLDGTLRIDLIDGFVPTPGESFDILTVGTGGSLAGQFQTFEIVDDLGALGLVARFDDDVSDGIFTVSFAPDPVTGDVILSPTETIVGNTAAGSFTLAVGDSFPTERLIIGNQRDDPAGVLGDGTVLVEGAGSKLTVTGGLSEIIVGNAGIGRLTVRDQGEVDPESLTIGFSAGSTGLVTVDNAILALTDEAATTSEQPLLIVGGEGQGTLNIANGGQVTLDNSGGNAAAFVGASSGAGLVTVDGATSSFDVGGFLGVGIAEDRTTSSDGTGRLVVSGGADVIAESVRVGRGGTVEVIGEGVDVGAGDTQSIVVQDGGQVTITSVGFDNLNIGVAAGDQVSVIVTGTDGATPDPTPSRLTTVGIDNTIQVGRATGSTGELIVSDGGQISTLQLEAGRDGTGIITITGAGSQAIASNDDGRFADPFGAIAGFVRAGRNAGGDGTIEVLDGASLVVRSGIGANEDTIGAGIELAFGSDSTGRMIVDGPGSEVRITQLNPGDPVNGLFGTNIDVGRGGSGSLTVSNQALVETSSLEFGSMRVGVEAGSDGNVEILSGGILRLISGNDSLFVSLGEEAGASGNALVSGPDSLWELQSGGFFAIGNAGTGTLRILDGGLVANDDQGITSIAREAGSKGFVEVTGSGSIESVFDAGAILVIGQDFDFNNGTPLGPNTGGDGVLELGESGVVRAGLIDVGSGGRIRGVGRIETGNLNMTSGAIAAGLSIGLLTIDGLFNLAGGTVETEVEVTRAAVLVDQISVIAGPAGGAGTANLADGILGFDLTGADGLTGPTDLVFLSTANGLTVNDAMLSVAVTGVTSDFSASEFALSFGASDATVTLNGPIAAGNSVAFFGSDRDDFFVGGDGDDQLFGGGGNDVLRGGAGNDQIFGEGGNDELTGDAGDDTLDGGPGSDLLSYLSEGGSQGILLDLEAQPGTVIDTFGDSDSIAGFERYEGSVNDDSMTGGAGAEELIGAGGNDTLDGRGGNDQLRGGRGADDLTGGEGDDRFFYAGPEDGGEVLGNVAVSISGAAGDILADFDVAGDDTLVIDGIAFGIDPVNGIVGGVNFGTIAGEYDGTNGGGSSTAWDNGEAAFLRDGAGNLIYDDNGAADGYTIVAQGAEAVDSDDFQVT